MDRARWYGGSPRRQAWGWPAIFGDYFCAAVLSTAALRSSRSAALSRILTDKSLEMSVIAQRKERLRPSRLAQGRTLSGLQ